MTEADPKFALEIKKLQRKADLSRYAHSRLHARYVAWQNAVVVLIAIISFVMTLRVLGYLDPLREWKEWMPVAGIILSALILFVQALSYGLAWKEKGVAHATALQIWGQWVHSVRSLKEALPKCSDAEAEAKMKNIHAEYGRCMERVESSRALIPNKCFLTYKAEFKRYVETSKNIDSCSADQLDGIIKDIKKQNIL